MCLYRSTDFNPRVSGLFLSETYIGLSGRRLSEEMRIDRWVVFERYRVFGIGKSSKPELLEQAFFHEPLTVGLESFCFVRLVLVFFSLLYFLVRNRVVNFFPID